jgi:hypothetical protein
MASTTRVVRNMKAVATPELFGVFAGTMRKRSHAVR